MTSAEEVIAIEELVGTKLPGDFRDWLLDDAAPYPIPSEVTIPADPPWIDEVVRLYRARQLHAETDQEHELNRQGVRDIPRQTLLIGDNELGDKFLLSLRANDFGSVYYLFHETASPEDDDWAGIFVLAATFQDWFGTLCKKEEEAVTSDEERTYAEERARILSTPTKPWWQFW